MQANSAPSENELVNLKSKHELDFYVGLFHI